MRKEATETASLQAKLNVFIVYQYNTSFSSL